MERAPAFTATADDTAIAPDKGGYRETGTPCTVVEAAALNHYQEEIANVIEDVGESLDIGNRRQMADVLIGSRRAMFGDGSDGNVTLVSNTTLTRDTYYQDLDLAGFVLNANGCRVFVRGTLTSNGGRIHNDGTDGALPGGSAGGVTNTVGGGGTGGDGGAGASQAGSAGGNINDAGIGAAGGDGGDGTSGGSGAGAGSLVALPAGEGGYRHAPVITTGITHAADGGTLQSRFLRGGSGGGGGGADSVGNDGGGGGGGGGICLVAAWVIDSTAGLTISANGGDGSAGEVGGGSGGGGGGGGGGGAVMLSYGYLLNGTPTIEVNGGAGGVGGGAGATAGTAGATGSIVNVQT